MNRVLVDESIMASVSAGTFLTRKTDQTTTQKVRAFIHTPHVMYTWLDGLADLVSLPLGEVGIASKRICIQGPERGDDVRVVAHGVHTDGTTKRTTDVRPTF
jgi:hypothetical protein